VGQIKCARIVAVEDYRRPVMQVWLYGIPTHKLKGSDNYEVIMREGERVDPDHCDELSTA